MTAKEALAKVRDSGRGVEAIYLLPVVDEQEKLVDMIELGDLVLADPTAKLMRWFRRNLTRSKRIKTRRLPQDCFGSGLMALPVVNDQDHLVGILTFDDAMEVLQESDTEDILRAGASEPLGAPYFSASLFTLTRTRAVWLMILALAATLTVNVLNFFQDALQSAITLTLFIPLLIGIGGNIGSQSATIIIRAMALGEVRFSDIFAVILREIRVGFFLGTTLGTIALLVVGPFFGWEIALVLGSSLLAIAVLAAFAGSLLPMLAKRIGIDPAVVSAPIISTLVDASGLIIYFCFAKIILT